MNSGIIPAPIASLPWKLIFLLCALSFFGGMVLYSAAGGSMQPWAGKHIARFLVFLAMAIVMSRFPLSFWKTHTFPIYGILIILLIVVEAIGFVGGGSQRWINLGFMTLQPSELMKPAVVLAVAWFFDRLPPARISSFDAVWPVALILGLPWILVVLQPDLGTSIAILFGGVVVAFLAGWPLKYFIGAGAALAALIPMAYFFFLEPYQQKRVGTFLDPESDPLGTGYHISQSKIAIGSGGLTGKGFLDGTQSHLD